MEPEYSRVGLKLTDYCPYDSAYFAREAEEYELADYHCAASTVVRDQLIGIGVQREIVRSVLTRTPFVKSFGDAPSEAGGWGATIVTLR